MLDPHSISPVAMARRKKRTKSRNRTSSRDAITTSKEIERDGVRFPNNLDMQHSVNTVLMQQAGKLRAKELREGKTIHEIHLLNLYYEQTNHKHLFCHA